MRDDEDRQRTPAGDGGPVMYGARMDAFLNRWFTTYDEARAALDDEGGFLFPFRSHFFVAQAEAVRELGLDPEDPDWQRIGRDWARPADAEAWQRLRLKREIQVGEPNGAT